MGYRKNNYLRLCMLSYNLCDCMCISHSVFRKTCFLGALHSLWLFYSLCLLFLKVLWALRGGIDGDLFLGLSVPRSLTLNTVWLLVSICSHLLQEEASLMMAEQDTDL